MITEREKVQILAELGLTLSQATIYANLAKYKDAPAKSLQIDTNVARQDVYQILSELQELGLVERIIDKPLRFRATPIKNALSILIHRQQSKSSEIQNLALKLFNNSEQFDKARESEVYVPVFEIRNVYRNDPRVKIAMNSTKVKIRLLDKNMNWPVFYSFIDEWRNALKRGVKVEILNGVSAKNQEPKLVRELRKMSFELRYRKNLTTGAIIIFDDREVAIWENPGLTQVAKSAPPKALWSNHRGLIELADNYFQSFWEPRFLYRNYQSKNSLSWAPNVSSQF